uniref:Ig-like domain-containing protein n=1 Tax=Timema monikensis TaxID=170555 RepID=A0A7R9E362_9NEOP|nr:unnamed protein product [Timema monikensis]
MFVSVAMQEYTIDAGSSIVVRGNSAVLRCIVPSFVKDFIKVTSWLQDGNFNIYPSRDGESYFLPESCCSSLPSLESNYSHLQICGYSWAVGKDSQGKIWGLLLSPIDGKLHMLPTGELVVVNAGTADSYSTYQCRVTHRLSDETRVSTGVARISVSEAQGITPPRFSERTLSIEARRDELVVLPCFAEGDPPPDYRWEFGGSPVPEDEQRYTSGGLLIIPRARPHDSGRYTCTASNPAGNSRLDVSLLVSWPLSARVSPALLTAGLDNINGFIHGILWKVPIQYVTKISVSVTPTNYQCALGQPAQMTCTTTGHPVTMVLWMKNGQSLSSLRGGMSGEVFHLASVSREDQGMYQCFVKNEKDMAQGTAELRLGDTPPQLVYGFIRQNIQPGPSVSLKCVASGNPTPNIKWTLDGYPLPLNERFVIGQYVPMYGDVISHVNITSVHVQEGGTYQCSAVNRVGEASHSAQLNVYGKLHIGQIVADRWLFQGAPHVRPMGEVSAVAGENLKITCPVAGFPIDGVKWYKGERELPINRRHLVFPNNTLVIEKVQSGVDNGVYRCDATDKQARTASGTAHVNVMVDETADDGEIEFDCVPVPPKITPFNFRSDLHLGERVGVQCVVSKGDPPLDVYWLKDGHKLGVHDGQVEGEGIVLRTLDQFTSVLSIGALALTHGGNYTCQARNNAALATHTAPLSVNVLVCAWGCVSVPPAITPFSFGELSAGERVRVTCSVKRGDGPIAISWLKDASPLMSQGPSLSLHDELDLTIQHLEEFSSVLAIRSVSSRHSGNYTCVASNPTRTTMFTAQLLVTVPPTWAVEPQNAAAKLGQQVVLDCKVEGFPKPTISWKKASGQTPGHYHELSTHQLKQQSGGAHLLPNGSLLLETVAQEDEGHYLCEASNGIGVGLSAVVQLTVHAAQFNIHFCSKPPSIFEFVLGRSWSVEEELQFLAAMLLVTSQLALFGGKKEILLK